MPKTKSENQTLEIEMDTIDIQTDTIISGIKLKSLCTKRNEYGTKQLFQVLDEKQLEDILKLAEENLKMPVWKYNDKCYLKVNDKNVIDPAVDKSKTDGDIEIIIFTKDMLYILDLTFCRYEFEKVKNKLKDIHFQKYIERDYQNPV